MAHRGMPDHGRRWKIGRDLLIALVLAGLASLVFIVASMLIRGSVPW